MNQTEHKHTWKMSTHIDGCHYYASGFACECGATASTFDERDIKGDPYSYIWMDNRINSQKSVELGKTRMYVTAYRVQFSVWQSRKDRNGHAAKWGVMVYGIRPSMILAVLRQKS
jgi:hypothetical protein